METEKTYTDSSTVKRIKCMPPEQILEVEFTNGSIYHYMDVPVAVMVKSQQAEKIGQFVAHEIKGKYLYVKVK
jgi:hypothetical protein